MYSSTVVPSEHKDLIHDVAFNWYGTQLATCSSDQTLRIWSVDQSSHEWHCTAAWKCHSGAVWKINWAHPEFGQVRKNIMIIMMEKYHTQAKFCIG